jgi:zinc transport system substrate-binding protein
MEKLPISKTLFLALLGFAFIALLSWFLSGGIFTRQGNAPVSGDKLKVVTSFFPIYDFTKNVAKDRVELDILFSQTPEVSSFSPNDIQKINNADILIKNGAGLEPVLDDLVKSSDNKNIIVVDTSRGVGLLKPVESIELEEHEGEEDHGDQDPHIWLNPQNAIIQVQNIRDALAANDPQNADFYMSNAKAYISSLRKLDEDIKKEVDAFSRKNFVAFHSAFQYFAKRYGLNQAATIEEFPGKEPSPRYIAGVIQTIRDLGVTAIFSEPQFSPKIVDVIANDLGIKVRILDPVETGDLASDSYISIMRKNLETLKEVIK